MKQLKEKIISFLFLINNMFFCGGQNLSKKTFLSNIIDCLLLIFLLILPWQTRLILSQGFTNGLYNEYTTLSLYGTEIFLWLIIVLFFIKLVKTNSLPKNIFSQSYIKQYPKRFFLAIFFLLSIFLATRFFSPVSWQFVGRFLLGVLLVVVVYSSNLSFLPLSFSLWLSGVGQGIFGFYQFLSQKIIANKWFGLASQDPHISGASVIQTGDERWLRAYGSFGSPNSLGIYLATLFILGLILYYNFIPKKYKLWFLFGQVLILLGLLSSFSRGAWIASLIGLFLFMFNEFSVWSGLTSKFFLKFLRSAVIYGAVVLVFIFSLSNLFNARFKSEGELENLSISERQTQITESRDVFLSHPLIGVGFGMYTVGLSKIIPPPSYGFYQPAHNIYTMILSEVGLIGIVTVFGLYFSLVWKISQDNFIFLPVVVVLFVAGLFDHWLWTMFTGLIFWWVIMGLGLKKINNKDISFFKNRNTQLE